MFFGNADDNVWVVAIQWLQPKAVVFCTVFCPLFVVPLIEGGQIGVGVTVATVGGLTCFCGAGMTLLAHHLARRMRANPQIGRMPGKMAGVRLVGFGIKRAIYK